MNPQELYNRWKTQYDSSNAKRNEIEIQIEKLKEDLDNIPVINRTTFVQELGEQIVEAMPGYEFDVLGPFGIDALISLHFSLNGETVSSLTFRSVNRIVDYTQTTADYPEGSMGALNGMNHPDIPLPETTEEIVAMLKAQEEGRGKG